jgi:hypothetical protein
MARWAISTGRWNRHEEAALKQYEEDFANAFRVEYETDPKGRRVRSKYAAMLVRDGKKITLWGDRKYVGRQFAKISLKQKRNQIVGDCYQLKIDVDSYNKYYNTAEPIQIQFDFTSDMEQLDERKKKKKSLLNYFCLLT